VRVLDRRLERFPAGSAEALEAGELRLDGDAGRARGVDRRGAVGADGGGGALSGCAGRFRGRGGLGPQAARVGVEPQDDLGLALRDEGTQPVAEVRTGRDPMFLYAAGASGRGPSASR
jgi:hypothetical protein